MGHSSLVPAVGALMRLAWGGSISLSPAIASGCGCRAASTSASSSEASYASSMADPLSAKEPLPTGLAFEEVYVDHDAAFAPVEGAPNARRGEEQPPITAIFLHGLLGSRRNWRSFARRLAQDAAARANRDVRALLVDLRCHGASAARFGLHPPHDMVHAADDVAQLVRKELDGNAPHIVVGLSLGGKVALQLLKQFVAAQEATTAAPHHRYGVPLPIAPPGEAEAAYVPPPPRAAACLPPLSGLPQQVWVLDSQPGTVPLDVDAPTSVGRIISVINDIPTPLDSRSDLYDFLTERGIPLPVAQWLGTSLAPGGRWGGATAASDKLDWVFDIQGAAALYNSYRLSSYYDVVRAPPPGVLLHIVRGEHSDRWTPAMLAHLEDAAAAWHGTAAAAPAAIGELRTHVLERAGHWLQADNPEGLLALMEPYFRDLHQNRLLF